MSDVSELFSILFLTLLVSGAALLISSFLGIPFGAWLGLTRLKEQRWLVAILYTGMALPPVVAGLFVYLLLSRSGPLSSFESVWLPRLFTPGAMILAQTMIAFPQVAGLTLAALLAIHPQARLQALTLGADRRQVALTLILEARSGIMVAIIAGFGSIISEVGAVLLVGGNIAGRTRVLTTAIVLETRMGNFEFALALGAVLLTISFLTNLTLLRFQGKLTNL